MRGCSRMPKTPRRTRSAGASAMPDQVLGAVMAEPWAITQEGLQRVLAVVSRGHAYPEALEARAGARLDNTRAVTVLDGVAMIPVHGPLVTRASFFDAISGATSYADIIRDITTAGESPEVRGIVLRLASPGGMAHGCWELGRAIRAADARKPIVAYVEGDACSAAYWTAAACRQIVIAESAILGCLGVQMAHFDESAYLERQGFREIVITSSQTPLKNRPPTDEDGYALWQRTADDLAGLFLSEVAALRGVDIGVVETEFGRGDVLVGARAVAAGLADRLATYDALHAELAQGQWPAARSPASSAPVVFPPSLTSTTESSMPGKPGATAAAARTPRAAAFDTNAEVRITVTREIGVTSGDVGTVLEVREGPMYRVQTGDNADVSYAWLAEDELEAASTEDAPSEDPPADPPADAPAARRVHSAIAAARAAGMAAERARFIGIAALAKKTPALTLDRLVELASDPTISVEGAALALLGEHGKAGALHLQNLASDEANALGDKAPKASADAPPAVSGSAAILAAMQQVNPRALKSSVAHGARPKTGA